MTSLVDVRGRTSVDAWGWALGAGCADDMPAVPPGVSGDGLIPAIAAQDAPAAPFSKSRRDIFVPMMWPGLRTLGRFTRP